MRDVPAYADHPFGPGLGVLPLRIGGDRCTVSEVSAASGPALRGLFYNKSLNARFFLALTLAAPLAFAQGRTQGQNQLDANPALFTVMAAINASGFNADLDSPSNHPLRRQIREALATKHGDAMDEMKRFYAAHHQRDANADLTQYISFALSLEGPPYFKFRVPESEMPPDVSQLRGLEQILPRFYEEAGIAKLWRDAQPEYEKVIDSYHAPVTQALLEATYYLRNPTSGYMGRRFEIFVDLLGPPSQVQTRNYKDDYFVVVTPSPELPIQEIRYSYLHYLLDPLALKYSEQLEKKRGMADYAQGAPALEDPYKNDYLLLTTTCLVKAIESRLIRGDVQRAEMVNQALREGFVFTPAFAEGLMEYEKQPMAMRLYFPELVARIDLKREEARLEKTEFVRERAVRRYKGLPALAAPQLTGAEKTLEAAEDLYRARDLLKARETYLRVLQETSQRPMHARAYYGLARVAALQKDPELAEKLFQKTLDLSPDPQTRGWAYVYLGRLASASGDREQAEKQYRAAIGVDGISAAARAAAEKELEKTAGKNK